MTTSPEQSRAQMPNGEWLKNPLHCLSLGFGSGLAPLAPGTAGTGVGVVIYLLMMNLDVLLYLAITLVIIGVGTWAAEYTSNALGTHDHKAIVIDEIAGFLVACISLPSDFFYLVLAFVLFRVFDIVKPWPVSYIDDYVEGGVGIVGDDLVAGLYTLFCVQSVFLIRTWAL